MFLALALFNADVFAAFNSSYWGVRPLGMGGAFSSVTNDANAPLYNPSGLAFITRKEVTVMSSRLFAGLEGVDIAENYLAGVYPFSETIGTVALAWGSESTPGLRREDFVNVGIGRYLDDLIYIHQNITLAAGVNLRYLRHSYNFDSSDPVDGTARWAVTGDIGLMAYHENGISVGFASRNLLPADLGFVNEDTVTVENAFGVSWYQETLPYLHLPYFTIACDLVFRESEFTPRIGAETWLIDGSLALRAGGREEELNFGFGYEFTFSNLSSIALDYALGFPLGGIEGSYGSHFVALSFKFD